jgi:hypothetical protein
MRKQLRNIRHELSDTVAEDFLLSKPKQKFIVRKVEKNIRGKKKDKP